MLSYYRPGDLVKSTRPVGNHEVPTSERRRLGIIVGHVPPGHMGNGYAVTQLLVFWTGPLHGHEPFTLEPDHRLQHV